MGDLREDLNAALESHDTEDENPQGTPAGFEAESNSDQETISDETPTEVSTSQSDSDTSTPPVENEASSSPDASEATTNKDSLKAPINWSPQQREEWSKIPRHLQEKIISREKEMDQAVAGTAEARKTHDYISQLHQQYAPILAAEGVNNPLEAVGNLFQQVSTLRLGSPVQKAQLVAQIINQYGVDIKTLDDFLVGETPQNSPQSEITRLMDQKLEPFNQVMSHLANLQQQGQAEKNAAAKNDVLEFSKTAEFFNDVRNDMADLVDMAAARGQTLTLQDAYQKACALNPEISRLMQERQQQQAIMGGNRNIQHKRIAASSLSGRQVGAGGGDAAVSLRDQIAQAWDDVAAQ